MPTPAWCLKQIGRGKHFGQHGRTHTEYQAAPLQIQLAMLRILKKMRSTSLFTYA